MFIFFDAIFFKFSFRDYLEIDIVVWNFEKHIISKQNIWFHFSKSIQIWEFRVMNFVNSILATAISQLLVTSSQLVGY